MKSNRAFDFLRQTAIRILSTGLFLMVGCGIGSDRDYYQLKIYTIDTEQQEERMDNFLGKAYLPALHHAGIPDVGVFKPVEEDTSRGKLILVLIPFKSLDEFEKLSTVLNHDAVYQDAGRDYLEAVYDNPPYRKVEMFNVAGEIALFVQLGFQPVFFGEVISGADMPNLMYMTTFSGRDSQQEHWKAFQESPDWIRIKEIEKYKNTVSHIDKWILHPAPYSDL
jgi:hypothetical protein